MSTDQVFDRISPRTLRTEVVEKVRQAIVSGSLAPGTRLREVAIAEQMAVSRSPVREALRELEQEGLVTSSPNQGARVRVFEARDIHEIFTIRAALETLACEVALANGGAGRHELAHLKDLLEEQRIAVREGEYERLTELDMTFHEAVCALSRFGRLMEMWRSLRLQMELLFNQRFRARPDYFPETVNEDHSRLIAALEVGDLHELADLHRDINGRVAHDCIDIIWGSRSSES